MIDRNIAIENAHIVFRNFAGKEQRFNPAGRRNFCVILDDNLANSLAAEGWNIRWLQPRDPDDVPKPYLQVTVNFGPMPPKVLQITSRGQTRLDENTIDILDWAEIANVDLIIRPYNWEVNGKTGVKAYLKSMYVTIAEDEFEKKYCDVSESTIMNDEAPF